MKKTVVLIEPTIQKIGLDYIDSQLNIVMAPDGMEDTLIRIINEHSASAVIIRTETITRKIIESCKTLEVIGMHGVGLDNIDVSAATENGVMVLNAPSSNYTSVAEHSLMSILALSRNLLVCDFKVRSGDWNYRERFYPTEINGKRLLIIGMGRVGQDLARKAGAFNLQVLGFDPFLSRSEMGVFGVEKIDDIDAVLPMCDFVSLHAPLTKSTQHLFSKKQFDLMHQNAFIINLGRGPLIDESALCAALENETIAGAALDVMEQEPPDTRNPLFHFKNVIFTPHVGGDTIESKLRCSEFIAREVCKVLETGISNALVNIHVIGNARKN